MSWSRGSVPGTPGSVAQFLEVRVDHHVDELAEADLGFPAELAAGLGGVAEQRVDLGGPDQGGVDDDVLLPVQADVAEGDLEVFADGMVLAGGDDEVVGGLLLEHEPHGADVVAGVAPVAFGVDVAEAELLLEAELDGRDGVGDLAGDELLAAAGAFVVEEDARAGEE